MKTKLYTVALFALMLGMTSCEKGYMGPVDETGSPVQLRGTDGSTDGEDVSDDDDDDAAGITDTNHGSDYDKGGSGKRKSKPN